MLSEETIRSVRDFQASHGLRVDGQVGDLTWAAVEASILEQMPTHPKFTAFSPAMSVAMYGDPRGASPIDEHGNFVPVAEWQRSNLVPVNVSALGCPSVPEMPSTVVFHRRVAPHFEELWKAWDRAGLFSRILVWSGSLAFRATRRPGSTRVSQHAYGAAFDINAPWCPMGSKPKGSAAKGSVVELVPIAQALGWYWGGWFQDAMHFEFSCP